jgi:2-dehydropantoate 2-reductase
MIAKNTLNIAVVGSGAMGSIYAGLLAKAGHKVWAIDIWAEHIKTICDYGLKIEGASGNQTVKDLVATEKLQAADQCDLYIIATKAKDVSEAAKLIKKHMRPNSIVLSIQNGLGSGERVAHFIPSKNIILGVADGFGASLKAPGVVHHHAMKLIRLGEMDGGASKRLQNLQEVWRSAGFNVKLFANIEQLIWEKFICNVTFSAPCTVFDCSINLLMANRESWDIALSCALEAYQIARLKNVPLSFEDPKPYVTEFGEQLGDSSPSMRLDHIAKRYSEIDSINGMVATLGEELRVSTPYNRVLSAVVRSREAAFSEPPICH